MRVFRIGMAAFLGLAIVAIWIQPFRSYIGYSLQRFSGVQFLSAHQDSANLNSKDSELLAALRNVDQPWEIGDLNGNVKIQTPNLHPLLNYINKYPGELGPRAAYARLAFRGSNPISSKTKDPEKQRAEMRVLAEVSERGEVLDRDNWFWRLGQATAHYVLDDIDQALNSLTRSPQPEHFKDYVAYEPERIVAMQSRSFWGVAPQTRLMRYASVLLPHLSLYRSIQKASIAQQDKRDPQVSLAFIKIGIAMARGSETIIGALVGKSLIQREVMGERKQSTNLEERSKQFKKATAEYLGGMGSDLSPATKAALGPIIEFQPDYSSDQSYVPIVVAELAAGLIGLAVMMLLACAMSFSNLKPLLKNPALKVALFALASLGTGLQATSEWIDPISSAANETGFLAMSVSPINPPPILALVLGTALVAILAKLISPFRSQHKKQIVSIILFAILSLALPPFLMVGLSGMLAILALDEEGELRPALIGLAVALSVFVVAIGRPSASILAALAPILMAFLVCKPRSLSASYIWTTAGALLLGLGLYRWADPRMDVWFSTDQILLQDLHEKMDEAEKGGSASLLGRVDSGDREALINDS